MSPAVHFGNERMANIFSLEYVTARSRQVPLVNLFDRHHCEDFVARIHEREIALKFDSFVVAYRQGDGYGKQLAAGQAHFFEHTGVIFRPHKPVQRTESAGCQQLEVADGAVGKFNRGKFFGSGQSFCGVG